MIHVPRQYGSESINGAMTSRTNGTLQGAMSGIQGGRYAPPSGTAPTTGGGEISCRGQNRGDLPRDAVREKLALSVESTLPGGRSLLGAGTAPKASEESKQNGSS